MQRSLEGGLALPIPEAGAWQQKTQGLGLELPVHKQEIAQLGVIGLIAVRTGPGVVGGLGGAPLHLAATAAEFKPPYAQTLASDGVGRTDRGELAKVDLAEGGASQVFGAKWKFFIVHRQGDFTAGQIRKD